MNRLSRVATTFLLLLCATTAAAQTVVRVESSGLPVLAAEVSAWDSAGRLAFGKTTVLGTVRLQPTRAPGSGAFLIVRRMGFAPVREAYVVRDSVTITLTAVPAVLPVLATNVAQLRCPSRDDAAAEQLWKAVASRYTIGTYRVGVEWWGHRIRETVTAEQRGYGDGSELTQSEERLQLLGNRLADNLEDPPPYAYYERHLDLTGENWRWRYAVLGGVAADHFLTERFRQSHTMRFLGTAAGATVIGFCARDYSDAQIEGELQISEDSLLVAARWFFRVPRYDEDVGGENTFATSRYAGGLYLMPVRGSSWRRAGRRDGRPLYSQLRFETITWQQGQRPKGQ